LGRAQEEKGMSQMDIEEFRDFLFRAKGQSEYIFEGQNDLAQEALDYLFIVLDTELLRRIKIANANDSQKDS
jgi:hypothetical protein